MTGNPAHVPLTDAHALAIGISRYQHLRPLPDIHDADDMAASLIDWCS